MAQDFRLDLASQVVLATSTVDANVTIPQNTVGKFPNTDQGSWWLMGVQGNDAYVNVGAAATTANVCFPVGPFKRPFWIPGGTVVHAKTGAGSGQVWFIRCYLGAV